MLVTYESLEVVDVEGVVRYVAALQQSDGSFAGDEWGEIDTRFSFCALATLALLVSALHVHACCLCPRHFGCASMRVHACAFMRVHACVFMHVHACVFMHVHACVFMHVHACVCLHVYM